MEVEGGELLDGLRPKATEKGFLITAQVPEKTKCENINMQLILYCQPQVFVKNSCLGIEQLTCDASLIA